MTAWIRARGTIAALAALTVACLLSSVTAAAPAAHYGPPNPLFAVYVDDVESALTSLDEVRGWMRFLELGDEGFTRLSELSREHLGMNVMDPASLREAGIEPNRGAAFFFYATPEPQAVLVFGASDADRLVRTVDRFAKSAVNDRYAMTKSKRSGGTYASWASTGGGPPDIALLVRDSLAFLGPAESIGYALGGVSPAAPPLPFAPVAGSLHVGMWFDLEETARITGERDLHNLSHLARNLAMVAWNDEAGVHMEAELEASEDIRSILSSIQPAYRDQEQQTLVFRELHSTPAVLFRLFVPLTGLYDTVVAQAGLTERDFAEFRKEIGVDLKRDIVDVFLGDMTIVAPTGLGDLRVEFCTADAGRARDTLLKLLGGLSEPDAPLPVLEWRDTHVRTLRHGSDAFVTEVRDGASADAMVVRVFWGFHAGRLRVALTPGALAPPTVKRSGGGEPWQATPLIAAELQTPSTVFAFMDASDLLAGYQDVIAIVRQMLSRDAAAIADIFDLAMLSSAVQLRSTTRGRLDESGLRFQAETQHFALTPEAPEGTAAGDFVRSLRELYRGHLEFAQRGMLAVSTNYPGTPEGIRAERYAFANGSAMGLWAASMMVVGSLSWSRLGAASVEYPDEAAPMAVTEPEARDVCLVWADLVCVYEGDGSKGCARGRKLAGRKSQKFSKAERQRCALELFELRGY